MPYYYIPPLCGIYYNVVHVPGPSWLPQLSLSSLTKLHDTASRTTISQTFANPSKDAPISDAKYTFPLYESSAVVSFRCYVGKRLIEGVVKEKEDAKVRYKEAVKRGETAGLLEQHTADVFSTSLGNIPAGETVKVEIEYIMELKHDAEVDGLRFTIPTSIAPRYGQLPIGLKASSYPTVAAGINISVELTMPSNIKSVQSPSHPITMHLGGHVEDTPDNAFNPKCALAKLSRTSTELGKDFILLVKCSDLSSPRALLGTHPTIPNSKALMVTLVPKFKLPEGPKPEIVFVVDRSVSMSNRMAPLKSALLVFLKSLPLGVKFNICSFGSTHSFLWKKSEPYSAHTLEEAQRHVESMGANFGDTEIYPPIYSTIAQRYKDLMLEIMVLTDGEVWNHDSLFEYVEKETANGDVRLFSLGIGQDVSHSLVEGLARVGRGFAQIVSDEKEGMEGKVVRMLKGGLSAHVNDYRLDLGDLPDKRALPVSEPSTASKVKKINLFDVEVDADAPASFSRLPDFVVPNVLQAPYQLPPLFPFSRYTAYAILSEDVPHPPSRVWLRGTTPSGDELELEIAVQPVAEKGQTIHQLAARKILQELEEGTGYIHSGKYGVSKESQPGTFDEWVKREGVRVGLKYGLASKWTSFLAVKQTEEGTTKHSEPQSELADDVYDFMDIEGELDESDSASPASSPGAVGFGSQPSTNFKAKVSYGGSSSTQGIGPSVRSYHTPSAASVPIGYAPTYAAPPAPLLQCLTDSLITQPTGMAFSPAPAFGSHVEYESLCEVPHEADRSRDMSQNDSLKEEEELRLARLALAPREQTRALIALQTFEGSFALAPALATLLEASVADLEAKLNTFKPSNPLSESKGKSVWATVLAIQLFETKLGREKDVWELVVEKAKAWMAGLTTLGEKDMKTLEDMAREILGV